MNKKALAAGEAAGLFDYHRVMELAVPPSLEVTNGTLYAHIGSLAQYCQYQLCDFSNFSHLFALVKRF